jgi:ubiquinone/menaquinone biosynthesis C-methylase UbiE
MRNTEEVTESIKTGLQCLKSTVNLIEVSDGISSVFCEKQRYSDYDSKVKVYDLVVGNRFYNRLMWGNWPSNYADFCQNALKQANGMILDAGCGSLVFTAKVYAQSQKNTIILFDKSLGMLQAGRKRIIELCGSVPKNIIFMQGDVLDLPFKNGVFDTVLCQGLLHLFKDQQALLTELERVKQLRGQLSFTSLVANNSLGRMYMSLLKLTGEAATVHSSRSLGEQLVQLPFYYAMSSVGNMAYVKSL